MTIRYHPPRDFTRGMIKMEWTNPADVVLRIAKPTVVGKKVVAPVVEKKPSGPKRTTRRTW